jgi:ribonuclease E
VRKPRAAEDEITALSGSTRLEAKKQRRREGREAGRRRAPIVSEAEFLARREAVERVMVIRQNKDLTQIAVLEDKVLVEHYVARESQTSLIGNVYLGRVQNVLPSMEAAFVDIGKGRNAVLYAGEVNWSSLGAKNGQARKIESVLKSGQSILVQVSKDPIGHKGARLTSQISLPGRFLVYVPDGTTSGISRKLPDTERTRLKTLLKEIVPDTAGVIVRTAAEGASEEDLTRDVERLKARWEDIESKVSGGNAPQLLYGEPDLTLKVVRDLFTEDFDKLVVSGDDAWDMVDDYVKHLAPDLEERLERYSGGDDVFAAYRIDEQIAKGLDRKVWLPSGGSLVIDRTEAMTVVDVNTGKFTGSGGNLEETVTKNNLEAAEEIVRQLRLRDIGGIIVVDFIDMVLESNRDLVLRRMVECLGRDRTRHQVAEVTSLGLVQMTRKRIGTGLLEAFSDSCEHCGGRGLIVHHEPVEPRKKQDDEPRRGRRTGRNRGRDDSDSGNGATPTPKDVAAMAKPDRRPDEQPERAADDLSWGGQFTEVQPTDVRSGDDKAGTDGVAAQPRTTTSSRRRGAKKAQPALIDDADEGATDLDAGEPTLADKPVAEETTLDAEAAPSTSVEAPATATAPKKVTTRKRSARRAQGPAGEAAVVTADDLASAGTDPAQVAPASEPVAQAPATAAPEPVTQTTPTVVATVRRRGAARRPAGPPPGAGEAGDGATAPAASDGATSPAASDRASSDRASGNGADAGAGDPGSGDSADDAQEHTVHVPVKKKGSRKR